MCNVRRMASSGILRRVALVGTNVSEELSALPSIGISWQRVSVSSYR
jgi:hypothetical protein